MTTTVSALADVWYRSTTLDVVDGSGCYVTAADGRRYLDFTSGIGAASTGHCHPRVVAAITEQASRFIHAQVNTYRHPLLSELADRLAGITPRTIERFFFSNSGAEAIEGAVKLARHATGRPNVIVFRHGFHGRTSLAMAMTTTKVLYRAGYGPFPPGVHVAPYPYYFRTGEDRDLAAARCVSALETLFATESAPADTAAVVVETVIGEGGYLVPPPSFLPAVADLCSVNDVLLVLDEIQCGFGRTGRFFACEHFGVEPDILVMAKGLASGFPISAVGGRGDVMERWVQGSHGGTYGGNPIGCAAALATIEVIEDEGLVENAAARGAELRDGLEAIASDHRAVGDVRGLGLMQAIELVDGDGRPDAERVRRVVARSLDEGVLLLTCGSDGNVIRFVPPLVVTAEETQFALATVATALAEAA